MVSIILPCYNAQSTIQDTLNSILNQTYQNFELICINDGSKDNTLDILNNYYKNSQITMKIISRENKGFLKSLDEGIRISSGEFIARIDSDDIWKPDHLEKIIDEFNTNNKLVLCGSNAEYIDINNNIIGVSNQPTNIIKYLMKDSPYIHSSVVFKSSIYIKTSGYLIGDDEGSKHIADYNLWLELSKFGECINLRDQTLKYRILDNSMSRTINRCVNYKSRLLVMKKTYKFYKKFHFFYFFNYIKVSIRIMQNCFLNKVFND